MIFKSFHLGIIEILLSLVAALVAYYYYCKVQHGYWKKRNVAGPKPIPFFGNFKDSLLMNISFIELLRNVYLDHKKEPLVGLYQGNRPVLMINDRELLRRVLIKDFPTFPDRGIHTNEKIDPLSAHLFQIEGSRWKSLRTKLSPTFTSGKLRQMFYLILEVANHFEKYIDKSVAKGETIECRELTAKYTTDVIGSCAFGLNMNSMGEEDGDFRKIGRKVFEPSFFATMFRRIGDMAPIVPKLLQLKELPDEVTNFFIGSIKDTFEYRKTNNIVRHDFVDQLLDIKANAHKADFDVTDELLAAQAFVFFLAGFETTSSTISYALYELAQHQGYQDKLRAEIRDMLEKNNNELSYEVIKEMKFLDMVFNETLRKHPSVPFLERVTVNDYTFPGSDLHLPVGMKILIPVLGLHHDPEYYPEPEVFDPYRFTEESKRERDPIVFLPFGEGPRNCIGARFANYSGKLGIIKLLQNYRVTLSEKMQVPYKIEPRSPIVLAPVGGIPMHFTRVE